jgi:CheY-like chemotaxis protein
MNRKLHSILLVEDNFMTNLYNQKIVEDLCIADHVIPAENGKEALDFLEHNQKNHSQPDLIFVDINMPEMSGWDFLAKCNKLKYEKGKPPLIVMLTVSHNVEDEKLARSIPNVIDYLTKPLTESKLLYFIKTHFSDVVTLE